MLTSNGWKTLVLVILPVWNGGITKCVCVCVCVCVLFDGSMHNEKQNIDCN